MKLSLRTVFSQTVFCRRWRPCAAAVLAFLLGLATTCAVRAEGDWEITPESELALARGLDWLAANQGDAGNWESNDLGLVAMGNLAFLADGHFPGRGKYGTAAERSINYVIENSKSSGLLNIAGDRRDMYNHGLATFVLGQAHGMTGDRRMSDTLDRALKLIAFAQCEDGGWDYVAQRQERGHDLSLAVMQAKALRSAVDSGLDVPPEVVDLAMESVREHYCPKNGRREAPESEQRNLPGQFTYAKGGGGGTIAMAAAGVVCLQEFGQYDDWRIPKNMDVIAEAVKEKCRNAPKNNGELPFDAYTMYYVGQALYQVGDPYWKECYPQLRNYLVRSQRVDENDVRENGKWSAGGHVGGKPGDLYGTSVACFILAMPNRYLPILQEGKIESVRQRFSGQPR
ncbi:MAG: squalene--hopene cyclase [Planctomycetales bacterium]|nr:squalene--hopene cyclase [Planctomycetales bacterium]